MAKRPQSKKDSRDLRAEALKLAAGYKVDGQSKEHTKLIAKGVARGIEQFLRQQSEKTRDLDKRSKQLKKATAQIKSEQAAQATETAVPVKTGIWSVALPWCLLFVSWGLAAFYHLG
jgi:hypothetical protein